MGVTVRLTIFVVASWLVLAFGAFAVAMPVAAAPSTAAGPAIGELEQLKATLNDEAKRKALIADIEALIAVQQQDQAKAPNSELPNSELKKGLIAVMDEARTWLATAARLSERVWTDSRQFVGWVAQTWRDPAKRAEAAMDVALFVGIFVAGWTVEYGLWLLASPRRRRLMEKTPPSWVGRSRYGLRRAVIEVLPIVGFFAAAAAFGLILGPPSVMEVAGLILALIYGCVRITLAVARLLLAPKAPRLRLLTISDPAAEDLYGWVRRIVRTAAVAVFLVFVAPLIGVPVAGVRLIRDIAVVVVAALLIAFVLSQRHRVAERLDGWVNRHDDQKALRMLVAVLAQAGHIVAVAALCALIAVVLLRIKGGVAIVLEGSIGSIVTLLVGGVVLGRLDRVFWRVRGIVSERPPSTSPLSWHQHAGPWVTAASWLAKILIVGVMVLGICAAWGADALGWLSSPFGVRLFGGSASILIVLILAALVWQLTSTAITMGLERVGSGAQATSRARTLLPLLRKVLFIVLLVIVGMVVLSEFGVPIAPLLAGAGIVGVAVGFGSQKLVQDVITGIFILIEDAVAIGDVVNVAGIGGLVEDISIRSIRLRDLSGNVHTVPFSSVSTVTNMTRGFSYYLLDIGVAYREDTDEVTKVCREILDEMRADDTFGRHILEPLEVLGVDQFADSAVIIKARIKTVPIQQWTVGREFNRRMKKRFDELGIEIPFPHQTIYFGVDKEGQAPPARVRFDNPVPEDGRASPTPSRDAGDAFTAVEDVTAVRATVASGPDADREGG